MNNSSLQFEQQQAECLAELGDRLLRCRQEQQISLEQVASETLISRRILSAIETGNLRQLPEPVYIQGFLRRYGDAIGLDGGAIARAFPTELKSQPVRRFWQLSRIQAQLRPMHLYLIYVLLVMAAVSSLSYLMNRPGSSLVLGNAAPPQRSRPVAGDPLASRQSAIAEPAKSAPNQITSKSVLDSTLGQKSVRVGLTLTDQSWIRVVADGKAQFEGVLPEGTQRTWVADRQLTVRAGNAGGVLVSFNDSQPKPMGEAGAVQELTFDARTQPISMNSTRSTSDLTASRFFNSSSPE